MRKPTAYICCLQFFSGFYARKAAASNGMYLLNTLHIGCCILIPSQFNGINLVKISQAIPTIIAYGAKFLFSRKGIIARTPQEIIANAAASPKACCLSSICKIIALQDRRVELIEKIELYHRFTSLLRWRGYIPPLIRCESGMELCSDEVKLLKL